ncbi:MAG: hypothetical protein P4L84_10615 [Isosphaeraceae bacterium]|nr:hypothetical protein [Isosphaeraceae bacterium]
MGLRWATRRTALLGLTLIADLLLIALWGARPRRLYSDWLGWVGDPGDAPLRRIRSWADDGLMAPRTPSGLISIFDLEDLLVATALLLALVLLSAALSVTWSGGTLPTRAEVPLRWLPLGRFRLRTALVAIALVGLYLGWELDAWRSWELWRRYHGAAERYRMIEASYSATLRSWHADLAAIEMNSREWPGDTRAEEARAADRAFRRDMLQHQIAYVQTIVSFSARLENKYARAAAHPRRPVDPDPPYPKEPDRRPLVPRGPGQAATLAAFTEQARRYPGLVSAHQERAWILATCPEPSLRDGKAAVASATRAYELTNGKDHHVLTILAAAYAEEGNFRLAVDWQRKAMERFAAVVSDNDNFKNVVLGDEQKRLDLYQAGKPFRMQ